MSIFGSILGKILHLGGAQAAPSSSQPAAQPAKAQPVPQPAHASTSAASTPKPAAAAQPAQPVDVEKVLTELAGKKGGGGNWRTSIVDLLKMLDLDSSLSARKELAKELNVHAGGDGSAEQNIALQKALWA